MSATFETYRAVSPTRRKLVVNLHPGQRRALSSGKQTVLVLAGAQSGKTVSGPHWLFNEIKRKGPGDYIVVTPTYPLLEKKALPAFLALFEREFSLGKYVGGSKKTFTFARNRQDAFFRGTPHTVGDRDWTRVLFGHAQDADSLESMTAKGAWLDESGQKKFKLLSYEAIQRRLAINAGRDFHTTTPYYLGWLKERLHDRAVKDDPEIDLVRFTSIDNPAFPRSSWDRAKRELPAWRFDLFYRAIFTRPVGMIFDSFDRGKHLIEPIPIPDHWKRYVGVDFGAVNTAALILAADPSTGIAYAYAEYYPQEKRSTEQHAAAIRKLIPSSSPLEVRGGAPSEDQSRIDFTSHGLPIQRPVVADVEQGIDRVWSAFSKDQIRIFNSLSYFIDELGSYSRELDDDDNPTDAIEDKSDYHLCDCARYILPSLFRSGGGWKTAPTFTGPRT